MPDPQGFDVRKAIEQSSTKSTLQDLAKRGIHRVKVLDEKRINELINDAVERIVSTKTNLLSPEDRSKLIDASRKELDRLMAEQRELKDKAELMERDKKSVVDEVENLQKQLQTQRKLADDTARQRYEDGKNVMRAEVEDMKKKMSSMEEEITRRVRKEVELEFQAKTAAQNATIEQMKADMARRENEARDRFERREKELRDEVSRREADIASRAASAKEAEMRIKLEEMGARSAAHGATVDQMKADLARRENELRERYEQREKALREELGRRETDIAARGASMKEAELRAKLDEMNNKNIEMAQQQTRMLEDMKKSDEDLFRRMTELFTKAIDGVSKKLSDLRLRSIAGGPVGAGASMPGDVEFRPSQATLESMLSSELDSNLKQMQQTEGKSAGKLGSALDRLKALRGGGGGETKKDEKKDEKKE